MAALTSSEWQDVLAYVRKNHANVVRKWFDELGDAALDHGILEIGCANLPQQRYLTEQCIVAFTEAAQVLTSRLVTVRFLIVAPAPVNGHANGHMPRPPAGSFDDDSMPTLNPEYTFDNFVVGPSNRLAHAASIAVSENPGEAYNPLFIHGSVGLGKTHLLQAICHHVRMTRPDAQMLFLSCETFNNHFIEAVEAGALERFRYRYRHVDVLLIDDIQFLSARERSQEEFFHTFNTLYQERKQIVLSADCCPREIPSLEDRLTSRFNWGLVSRIDTPCLETRMAIVQKKSRNRNVDLPEDVVHHLASCIDSNTRELEGAITLVDALSQQHGRPVDIETAREAIGEQPSVRHRVSVQAILDDVAAQYAVTKAELLGRRRHKSIALPRQVCMYLARNLTELSLQEIGNRFGGRDHTTVMHAIRHVDHRRQEDHDLSVTLDELSVRLANGVQRPK